MQVILDEYFGIISHIPLSTNSQWHKYFKKVIIDKLIFACYYVRKRLRKRLRDKNGYYT